MVNAKEISNFLGTTTIVVGDSKKVVYKISKIIPGKVGTLSFCKYEDGRAKGLISRSRSSIIICSSQISLFVSDFIGKTFILVPQPRLAFMKAANEFFPWRDTPGIHPTAVISNAEIGKNVRIGAGTVIGGEGFGYMPDENGELIQFPHIGGVIIEDNVEIGVNVCIDRGALGDTIIGRGTKIDNLVHVAHNVKIGKNCQIICLVGIGGSVEIGDNSFVGISACIRNQIKIGKNAVIGMGAVVVKNVPDNMTVAGNPANPIPK
ncbi:UDP-3-O-(3-hydroxymyristoyl)glucosamine N-acyltransferase [Patescibacteria group bacterium]|nr:UDP-3-O-(3-hydroxymyristoyl)glucosamine N-acyltransferase [Patescibacteria group bacterium]